MQVFPVALGNIDSLYFHLCAVEFRSGKEIVTSMAAQVEYYDLNKSPPSTPSSEDSYIKQLHQQFSLLKLHEDNSFFKDFNYEPCKEYLKQKESNFEGLSEYELKELTISLAKDCMVMKLKNEIFENYLKRQNPTIDIDDAVKKEELTEGELFAENKFLKELENSGRRITSKELYWKHQDAKKLTKKNGILLNDFEEENIKFLATIVEREIGELYRTAKKKGLENERRYAEIQAKQKSIEDEVDCLEEGLKVFQSMFGELLSAKKKRRQRNQLLDPNQVLQYFHQETKRLDQKSRRINVKSAHIGKELKRLEDWHAGTKKLSPVDLEVLQVECDQLQELIDKNEQEFLGLKSTLDKLNRKLAKETESARDRHENLNNITTKLDKMKKKVQEIKANRELAECELRSFEKQRMHVFEDDCSATTSKPDQANNSSNKKSYNELKNMKKTRCKIDVKKNIIDNFETF